MERGILFDLDGTLADTALDLLYACNHTLDKWHLEAVSEKEIKEQVSSGVKAMLSLKVNDAMLLDYPRDTLMRQEFLDFYQKNICTKTVLFAGILEVIAKLKELGFKIAVVTGKYHDLAKNLVNTLGLSPYLDLIVGSDECIKPKPHPDSLRLALSKLDLQAENCLYVGDHLNDIKAAHNAKMQAIAVAWGYGIYDCGNINLWQADFIAYAPLELLDLIHTHFKL